MHKGLRTAVAPSRARDCIDLTNILIRECHLSIPCVKNVREINSVFFLSLYEVVSGENLPGGNSFPETLQEEIKNLDLVVNTFASQIIKIPLPHITGIDIAQGNLEVIFNLLQLFHAYLSYVSESIVNLNGQPLYRNDRLGIESDGDATFESQPKESTMIKDHSLPKAKESIIERTSELVNLGDTAYLDLPYPKQAEKKAGSSSSGSVKSNGTPTYQLINEGKILARKLGLNVDDDDKDTLSQHSLSSEDGITPPPPLPVGRPSEPMGPTQSQPQLHASRCRQAFPAALWGLDTSTDEQHQEGEDLEERDRMRGEIERLGKEYLQALREYLAYFSQKSPSPKKTNSSLRSMMASSPARSSSTKRYPCKVTTPGKKTTNFYKRRRTPVRSSESGGTSKLIATPPPRSMEEESEFTEGAEQNVLSYLVKRLGHFRLTSPAVRLMERRQKSEQAMLAKRAAQAAVRGVAKQAQPLAEAIRRQTTRAAIRQREERVEDRLKTLFIERERRYARRATGKEAKMRAARMRVFQNEHVVRDRARTTRYADREEVLFREALEEGLKAQRQHVFDTLKEERNLQTDLAEQLARRVEQMEKFYLDQIELITDTANDQRRQLHSRRNAQITMWRQLKSELERNLSEEIRNLERELVEQGIQDIHVREREAERVQRELRNADFVWARR